MDGHWSLVVGIAGGILATVLSATRMALNGFSGGRLRKLELRDRELAQRLEPRLEKREEYRLLLRLFQVTALVLVMVSTVFWDRHCIEIGLSPIWCWLPVALGGTLFLGLTEAVGGHLSTLGSARMLGITLPVMDALAWLLVPVTGPIMLSQRWAARWRERRTEVHGAATAEDEIMSLVEKTAENGEGESDLEDDERRMIRGIFDLDETLVHEIMTPRVDVDGIEQNATVEQVKAFIVQSGHSRIPVYRETIDQIIGIVYAKDLLDEDSVQRAESLTELLHTPMFVPETKNVGDLLEEFRQERNHFAVALDEYGGTAGIVTIEDVLEEIVGDIRDEYDIEEDQPAAEESPDGGLIVDARTTIDEINQSLGIDLPEDEDFDTVGGYISAQAGRIPQQGEVIETEHLVAEILLADPRRVLKAKVQARRDENRPGDNGQENGTA